MLVVSRKVNERVFIECPDGTTIAMVIIRGGSKVRVGFEAPREVRILREELRTEAALENAR